MRRSLGSARVFRETRRVNAREYYAQIGMVRFARRGEAHTSIQKVGYGRKTVDSRKVRRRKRGFGSRHWKSGRGGPGAGGGAALPTAWERRHWSTAGDEVDAWYPHPVWIRVWLMGDGGRYPASGGGGGGYQWRGEQKRGDR